MMGDFVAVKRSRHPTTSNLGQEHEAVLAAGRPTYEAYVLAGHPTYEVVLASGPSHLRGSTC